MNHNNSVLSTLRSAAPSGVFVSATLLALSALTFACADLTEPGDGETGNGTQPADEGPESPAALRIFVPGADGYSQVDVPPLSVVAGDASTYQRFVALTEEEQELMSATGEDWGSPPGDMQRDSAGASAGSQRAVPPSRTMGTVISIGGGATTAEVLGEVGQAFLLRMLAADCGLGTNPLLKTEFRQDFLLPGKVADDRYYVFEPPETCDLRRSPKLTHFCSREVTQEESLIPEPFVVEPGVRRLAQAGFPRISPGES